MKVKAANSFARILRRGDIIAPDADQDRERLHPEGVEMATGRAAGLERKNVIVVAG